MRRAAAEAAVELFHEDPRVAVVLAEISTDLFEPAFRHDARRALNVGIMEQTMVGVAAGFALEGFLPIVHTIAPFLAERALEQVKLDFGYQGLEGLFISTGASYDYGTSGFTHHSPGDVAALATVPRMEIVVPGAAAEAHTLVRAKHGNGRPTYVRTTVAENAAARKLATGGLTPVRRGAELTVVAVGPMLDRTLAALDGIDATVVVEPFFEGTLAGQVTAALSHRPTRLLSIGVPRRATASYGTVAEHDHELGLDVVGIRGRILAFAGSADRRAA
jgi:transketolase